MAGKIFRLSFYALFILTPLLFTPYNNELFEFNKMLLVYGLTAIITGSWVYQMISQRKIVFKRTPLDLPLLLFLVSQILSTILSIDRHTSIWGYYSRSNGGLLSIISYLILYWAFVSNVTKREAFSFLKASLIGGVLVALWAIPEHFGYSPSCALLVGRWAADCWVQDVQSRVFATLGQPNWLAAYMEMLLFPALYFFLHERAIGRKILYFLALIAFYLAFTFTFSRGGMLGVVGGMVVLIAYFGWGLWKHRSHFTLLLKPFAVALISLVVINLLFGSALTGSFRLIKENAPPPRPSITGSGGGTQLENGGTESGQIRLIVWKGALEIFKHYPIFGSGVETYAYSYYMFRPVEHNLVSEWDFLYNKAHNEYLNYLATTGIVGFLTYMLFIVGFIIWSILRIYNLGISFFNQKIKFQFSKIHHLEQDQYLLIAVLLASYISYLIQNFFGFSVVMIAVLFYLLPAIVFVVSDQTSELKIPYFLNGLANLIDKLYEFPLFMKIVTAGVILLGAVLLFGYVWGGIFGLILLGIGWFSNRWQILIVSCITLSVVLGVFNLWRADVNYKIGSDAADSNNATEAYNSLLTAYDLNPREPLYQSDFGNVAASAAVSLSSTDATQAADLKDQAIVFTQHALTTNPANVSLWRTAIRTYYVLSVMDPGYNQKTIETIDKTISLAPTDPKLYYNKALILSQQKKLPEAIEAMKKAIELKSNYREAKISLGDLYTKNNQQQEAINILNQVLKDIPNDPDALKVLNEATASGLVSN